MKKIISVAIIILFFILLAIYQNPKTADVSVNAERNTFVAPPNVFFENDAVSTNTIELNDEKLRISAYYPETGNSAVDDSVLRLVRDGIDSSILNDKIASLDIRDRKSVV